MKKLLTIALAVIMMTVLAVNSLAVSFDMEKTGWGWGTEYDPETQTIVYTGAWKGAAFMMPWGDEYRTGVSTVTIEFADIPFVDLEMSIQDVDGNRVGYKWFPAGTDDNWTFEINEGDTVQAIEIKAGGEAEIVIKALYTNGDKALAGAEAEEETPVTEAPETEAPVTDAPETEAPVTDAPETEAPATEATTTETEAPETEAPVTEAPETEAPATEAPAEEDEGNLDGGADIEVTPDEAPVEEPAVEKSSPVGLIIGVVAAVAVVAVVAVVLLKKKK